MATRASLITKARNELGELGAGVSQTDSAAQGNHYHFAINDALGILGLTDADLTSADNNTLRIVSIGVQYYVMRSLVKAFISIPRLDTDQVSRDHFARAMELLRWTKKEFEAAISGEDIPREESRYAESVVTWATGFDGASDNSVEGNVGQKRSNDFYIDDLGIDRSSYTDDGS
jgi:hypothetical protein